MNTDESDVIRRWRVATNYHCIFNILRNKKKNISTINNFFGKKRTVFRTVRGMKKKQTVKCGVLHVKTYTRVNNID